VDGTVGMRAARVGEYVQPGTQLMAVVPLRAVYIVANYEETQLTDVRPGQPVTIAVDTFPGVTMHGHVDSLAPASGEEFALLPPDNATGNFTKIVQRIPVKIMIDKDDPWPACCARACRSNRPSTPARFGPALLREGVVTDPGDQSAETLVPLKTWIAVGGALIGAFLAVLNIQITNASLPYIEGGIGTGGVYGTWVSTAYLIGEIIVIPLTDFLSRVFFAAPLSPRQYGAVPRVLGALRTGSQPRRDDRAARPAGFSGGS